MFMCPTNFANIRLSQCYVTIAWCDELTVSRMQQYDCVGQRLESNVVVVRSSNKELCNAAYQIVSSR